VDTYKERAIESKAFIVDVQNELELIRIEIFKLIKTLTYLEILELSELVINEAIKITLEGRLGFILTNKKYIRLPVKVINLVNYISDIIYFKIHKLVDGFNVNVPLYNSSMIQNGTMHIVMKWSKHG